MQEGDCRRWPGIVRESGGRLGTGQVMSHEVKRICLELYDFKLASTGGPTARIIASYRQSSVHLPESSQSQLLGGSLSQSLAR